MFAGQPPEGVTLLDHHRRPVLVDVRFGRGGVRWQHEDPARADVSVLPEGAAVGLDPTGVEPMDLPPAKALAKRLLRDVPERVAMPDRPPRLRIQTRFAVNVTVRRVAPVGRGFFQERHANKGCLTGRRRGEGDVQLRDTLIGDDRRPAQGGHEHGDRRHEVCGERSEWGSAGDPQGGSASSDGGGLGDHVRCDLGPRQPDEHGQRLDDGPVVEIAAGQGSAELLPGGKSRRQGRAHLRDQGPRHSDEQTHEQGEGGEPPDDVR